MDNVLEKLSTEKDDCSIYREYKLNRLDKANVIRSLGGAIERASSGRVLLHVTTKSERLSDEFDQIKCQGGGCYVDGWSQGRFNGDFLIMECSGWTAKNGMFEHEVGIKLCEIHSPIWVGYSVAGKMVVESCICPVCGKDHELNFGIRPLEEAGEPGEWGGLAIMCRDCFDRTDLLFGSQFMEALLAEGELGIAEWFGRAAMTIPGVATTRLMHMERS
jgi:hypothetical protein